MSGRRSLCPPAATGGRRGGNDGGVLAILAPGQGAQTPGQLRPWLDLPGAPSRLRWWSAAAGVDLVEAGTSASDERIRDTVVAQPLIVATGLLAAEHLDLPPEGAPTALAGGHSHLVTALTSGHSVGEITAAAVAGALEPEVALLFVRARGQAMAEASARAESGMTALLGGDPDTVTAHLGRLGLVAANRNGAGQVVAAGTAEALRALADDPPPGARLRPLQVAGAFHTEHMIPARDALAALAPGIRPRDPWCPLVSNADGAVVASGAELVGRLVAQVAAPVRWDLCQSTLRELGVTSVVELPPAGTLAGLARRELPGIEIVALKTPDDLGAARELAARHAAGATLTTVAR